LRSARSCCSASLFALVVLGRVARLPRRIPALRSPHRSGLSPYSTLDRGQRRHVRQFRRAYPLLPLADATAFTFATPLIVVPTGRVHLAGEMCGPYAGRRSRSLLRVGAMLSDHLGEGVAPRRRSARLWRHPSRSPGAASSAVAMLQTRAADAIGADGATCAIFPSPDGDVQRRFCCWRRGSLAGRRTGA